MLLIHHIHFSFCSHQTGWTGLVTNLIHKLRREILQEKVYEADNFYGKCDAHDCIIFYWKIYFYSLTFTKNFPAKLQSFSREMGCLKLMRNKIVILMTQKTSTDMKHHA